MQITISDGCSYVKLTSNKITYSNYQEGGYVVDYDENDEVVGIEYLEEAVIKKDTKWS